MYKFYFLLWFRWVVRLSLCSVFLALALSFVITAGIYFLKGNGILDTDVLKAVFDIWIFWTLIAWNFTLLIALYRSVKYLFNNCLNGYSLKLLECNSADAIEVVGYGDLPKVTRKWMMSLIWLVSVFIIVALIFTKLFASYDSLFEWFNIYWLYLFLVLSGFISFVIFTNISKKVKVSRC